MMGEVEGVIIKPGYEDGTIEIIEEPNVKGELCLTGPGVTMGYAGNSKEQTEKVFIKHPCVQMRIRAFFSVKIAILDTSLIYRIYTFFIGKSVNKCVFFS